jgi:hypothetical protein
MMIIDQYEAQNYLCKESIESYISSKIVRGKKREDKN